MLEQKIQVGGMSCQHCKKSIEDGLKEIDVQARVQLDEGSVTLQYDDAKVKLESIKSVIIDLGYEVA